MARASRNFVSWASKLPAGSCACESPRVSISEILSVRSSPEPNRSSSAANVAALDDLLGSGEDRTDKISLSDTLGDAHAQDPAGSFEAQETKFLLARAIEQLGEREKIVLVLYYYEGMTLAEIGRVLGVTESRISQMHTAAMLRLRQRLQQSERD